MSEKIEINALSWDAAFAVSEFAKKHADHLANEASRPLPENARRTSYLEHIKAAQAKDAADLYRFSKQIMVSLPAMSETFKDRD